MVQGEAVQALQDLLNGSLKKYLYTKFRTQGDNFIYEVALDTWHKVWSNAGQCRGKNNASILAWVKTIAYRIGLNRIRDNQRLVAINESRHDDEKGIDQVIHSEALQEYYQHKMLPEETVIFREQIKDLLDRLTENERKVFILRIYGYNNTEIAEKLQISNPRVSQYVSQIQQKNKNPEI